MFGRRARDAHIYCADVPLVLRFPRIAAVAPLLGTALLVGSLLGCGGDSGETDGASALAPRNDAWRNAVVIAPAGGMILGSLAGATPDGASSLDAGEETADVWYQYTSLRDQIVQIHTCGTHDATGVDTVVSVHAGGPAAPANEIAASDSWSQGEDEIAECRGQAGADAALSLSLQQFQILLIRVARADGDGEEGGFLLTVPAPGAGASGSAALGVLGLLAAARARGRRRQAPVA